MSEREEFGKWYKSYPEGAELTVGDMLSGDGSDALAGWQACTALTDKRIAKLEAKLEAIEKQEPVGKFTGKTNEYGYHLLDLEANYLKPGTKLYAIPPLRELDALAEPDVPEGWQLAPVEPSAEQRFAGMRALAGCSESDLEMMSPLMAHSINEEVTRCYTAMLAAAPKKEE
jgi:hypothetical protein